MTDPADAIEPQFIDRRSGAVFSNCREYRYRLWRTWDVEKPVLAWIMLNPSTADEVELDPTCTRCRGYAQDWGFGTLHIGNIFALRSTDPAELYSHDDPIGSANDDHLEAIATDADKVLVGWGNHGDLLDRGREVVDLLDADLYALGTTKSGEPYHPLYQPSDAVAEPFEYRSSSEGGDLE